jgi:hypothetical protein
MKINDDNITLENNILNKYMNNSIKEIEHMICLSKSIYSQGKYFCSSIVKEINTFFDIEKSIESNNKMSQNLNFYYQSTLIFFSDFLDSLEKYNLIIVQPLEDYKQTLKQFNDSMLSDFNLLLRKYNNSKEKIIKSQRRYYASKQLFIKNKKELISKNLNLNTETYYRLKSISENNHQLYKYQILSNNDIYKKYDNFYEIFYSKFKENENNRLSFLRNIFEIYINDAKVINNKMKEYISQIFEKLSSWKQEEDLELILKKFNFNYAKNKRFKNEEYMKFSQENVKAFNSYVSNIQEKTNPSFLEQGKEFLNFMWGSSNEDIYEITNNQKEEKQNEIIEKMFKYLLSDKEISFELISIINSLIIDEKDFSILLIKKFISINKSSYTKVSNFNNLKHLGNILNNIILNSELDFDNATNLALAIIFNSQRTYSIIPKHKNEKIFLCGIINNKFIFKSQNFWDSIFEFKLKLKLKAIMNLVLQKYNNLGDNKYSQSIQKNTGNILNNIFSLMKQEEEQEQDKGKFNKFIKLCNFSNFDKLSKNYQIEFIQNAYEQLHLILKENILFFINYNFGINNGIDFIVKVCNDFNMSNEFVNYYILYLNSSSYSIRQFGLDFLQDYKTKNKIDDIIEKRYENINLNYPIYEKIKFYNDSEKKILLLNCSIFLTNKEKISLLLLNKNINLKISKTIYKQILNSIDTNIKNPQNNINIKKRVNIWKILLKYQNIKDSFPYITNKIKATSITYDRLSKDNFSIIDIDCQRTNFKKNEEENRKIINNILKTISMLLPEINYCQGMNYIVAFLLEMINEEETVFYIMMGIFVYTKFKNIFYNDLIKLKLYFKIIDRILTLYLPTTVMIFKNNNIMSNYFLSPWIITLFTNTIEVNFKLDIIIKIFDNFIVSGWKTIFNTILLILKKNEENIINLKSDKLLHYLSHDILKVHFYGNESDNFLLELKKTSKIKKKLINNLKKELTIESQILKEN